jgi:DNA-binding transcriptional MerR regulator
MTKRRLKMRDLERATGVGRETIRFYIREGLLPEPERPSRNVAWYDESFVERIALIKELQQKRFLPLHVIKAMVNDTTPSRDEVRTLLELDGKLFPALGGAPAPAPERLSDVAKRARLRAAEIRQIADTGAIEITTHAGNQWLDENAVRIVELWAKLRAAGYTDALGFGPQKLRVYVEFVGWLAREELRLFTAGVTGRVDTERSAHMAEAGITHINQIIALLRKTTLLRYIAEGNIPASADESPVPAASGDEPPRR